MPKSLLHNTYDYWFPHKTTLYRVGMNNLDFFSADTFNYMLYMDKKNISHFFIYYVSSI